MNIYCAKSVWTRCGAPKIPGSEELYPMPLPTEEVEVEVQVQGLQRGNESDTTSGTITTTKKKVHVVKQEAKQAFPGATHYL